MWHDKLDEMLGREIAPVVADPPVHIIMPFLACSAAWVSVLLGWLMWMGSALPA